MKVVQGGTVSRLLKDVQIPEMFHARQTFPREAINPQDIPAIVEAQIAQPEFSVYPGKRFRAGVCDVEAASKILRNSQKGVMICGQGALLSGAWQEVEKTAEKYGLAVLTTINGKGIIDESSMFSGGIAGESQGTIEDCIVSGSISGSGIAEGGIAGRSSGTISGCTSSVSTNGDGDVGGIAEIHPHAREDLISEHRAALRMIVAVDAVPYIMQVPRDPRHFDTP